MGIVRSHPKGEPAASATAAIHLHVLCRAALQGEDSCATGAGGDARDGEGAAADDDDDQSVFDAEIRSIIERGDATATEASP